METADCYSCFAESVRRYAYSRTPFYDDAEDAASESLASCIASNQLSLALARKIVRRRLADMRQEREREVLYGLSGEAIPVGLLASAVYRSGFRSQTYGILIRMIEAADLAPKKTRALIARAQGYTYREIASELRVSIRMAQYYVARGVLALGDRNPDFERLFRLMSRVTVKRPVRSLTTMAGRHLHRNPRNDD